MEKDETNFFVQFKQVMQSRQHYFERVFTNLSATHNYESVLTSSHFSLVNVAGNMGNKQ